MAETDFNQQPTAKKGGGKLKYVLYILIVLVATGISLYLSLYQTFDQVVDALARCDFRYLLVIVGLVAASYCVDALIILVFCRLYTRRYKFHQGLATSLVGQFYSSVTPGASGGQVMQVYTMKSQGVQVSNAASIAVMWSIIYQVTLILIDIVALAIDWQQVMNIDPFPIATSGDPILIPITPLVIFGFGLNLFVILMLFTMSYSHRFHNFILHYVIGFLGKIHLVKNPDKTREGLRVQVENFKLELRRLMSNIPVLILEVVLFFIMIMLRSSVPYFAGLALHAWGEDVPYNFFQMMDAAFMSNFHQMVTGLIPIPGAAGVSEFFYNQLFKNYFNDNLAIVSATQIIWRTATFHAPLLIAGMVAALYRSRGQAADIRMANRKTFVTLQLETYDERRRSTDTMYETKQFSRKEVQRRLNDPNWKKNVGLPDDPGDTPEYGVLEPKKKPKQKPEKPAKAAKEKKKKVDDWEHWDL